MEPRQGDADAARTLSQGDLVHLGGRLRAARERAGLTRSQVAARITEETGQSLESRSIWRWETGRVDVPMSRLYQFARAVGCDASELMCPPPAGAPR